MKNKNNKTIHSSLESWGKNQREVPKNNDALKSEILAKVELSSDTLRSVKPQSLPWISFAFTAMAILVFLININGQTNTLNLQIPQSKVNRSAEIQVPTVSNNSTAPRESVQNFDVGSSRIMPYYGGGTSAISDNREFLKTSYNATLQTRHVSLLTTRIQTMIRGFGGRVDSANSGDKWGRIDFALPKEELLAFQNEVKDLVGVKFYREQISSENLLSQKQNIEANQKQYEANLSGLRVERAGIVKLYNQNISSYQNNINSLNKQITDLTLEYQSANTKRKSEINSEISVLQAEINTFKSKIINENKSYQNKIANIDAEIKNTQKNIEIVQGQDVELLDNVATVNGSISLNWIGLWEMTDLYLPGPLLAYIFILIAIAYYFWHRRFVGSQEYF